MAKSLTFHLVQLSNIGATIGKSVFRLKNDQLRLTLKIEMNRQYCSRRCYLFVVNVNIFADMQASFGQLSISILNGTMDYHYRSVDNTHSNYMYDKRLSSANNRQHSSQLVIGAFIDSFANQTFGCFTVVSILHACRHLGLHVKFITTVIR